MAKRWTRKTAWVYGGTGHFYTTSKNKKTTPGKIEDSTKFDPEGAQAREAYKETKPEAERMNRARFAVL